MNNPKSEIGNVVKKLVTGTAEEQQSTLQRYFTQHAAFNHPLCVVYPSAHSRDLWMGGIYTWYKIMSPGPGHEIEVHNVWYDEAKMEVILEMSQTFHIFLSPFKPHPARLLTKLQMVQENDLYYISSQEDFYQPESLAHLIIPPLATVINAAKRFGTFASLAGAFVGQNIFGQRVPEKRSA